MGVSKGKILKAIQNKFGHDWNGLKKMEGIKDVEINVTTLILKLSGTASGIERVNFFC